LKKVIELTDGTIIIKPFQDEDAEEHLQGEDSEQVKWLNGGRKSTIDSVRSWITRNRESREKGGPVFNFAIRTVEDGKLIGMVEAGIDFESIEGIKEGDANISYGLYPVARGKGYAVRAVSLMADFLKAKGLKQAIIRSEPENTGSLKVPERCGFTRTGQIVTGSGGELIIFEKKLQ
jgi:RimJ/RimL family protein N-acetyltransferase